VDRLGWLFCNIVYLVFFLICQGLRLYLSLLGVCDDSGQSSVTSLPVSGSMLICAVFIWSTMLISSIVIFESSGDYFGLIFDHPQDFVYCNTCHNPQDVVFLPYASSCSSPLIFFVPPCHP